MIGRERAEATRRTPSRNTPRHELESRPATDLLSVRFTDAVVVTRREGRPGLVVAYAAAGTVAAMEIRTAPSERLAADQDLRRLAEAA